MHDMNGFWIFSLVEVFTFHFDILEAIVHWFTLNYIGVSGGWYLCKYFLFSFHLHEPPIGVLFDLCAYPNNYCDLSGLLKKKGAFLC